MATIVQIALGVSIGGLILAALCGGAWIWIRYLAEPAKYVNFPLKIGTRLFLWGLAGLLALVVAALLPLF